MPNFTITQQTLDNMAADDVAMTFNGSPVQLNDVVSDGQTLIATTPAGYAFEVSGGAYLLGQDPVTAFPLYQNFTLSNNNKTATLVYEDDGETYYYAEFNLEEVTPDVTGSNNVYEINREKLYEINDQRFEGTPPNVFDYGVYILSVIELPFTIPAEIKTTPDFVELGSLETTTEADVIVTDKILVDLGEVSISGTDSNLLDYSNTVAFLHLPRTTPIALELEYVIDETISIEYIIDCYSGVATINISSTKIDGVISTSEVDLGVSIPYGARNGNVTGSADNLTLNVGGDNGVLIPFIELVKSNSDLHSSPFVIPVNDYGDLSSETGFIVVEEINLDFQALASEKDSIRQALQSGVIINE